MTDPFEQAAHARDCIAYAALGLLTAIVDDVPALHRQRAREIVDEFRRRDDALKAAMAARSPAPAEAPSGPNKAVSA